MPESRILDICEELLAPEEAKYPRFSLKGRRLDYNDQDVINTDQLESVRTFLHSIRRFVGNKVNALIDARKRVGLAEDDSSVSSTRRTKARAKEKGIGYITREMVSS